MASDVQRTPFVKQLAASGTSLDLFESLEALDSGLRCYESAAVTLRFT